jgi:hypothetical protein
VISVHINQSQVRGTYQLFLLTDEIEVALYGTLQDFGTLVARINEELAVQQMLEDELRREEL